MEKTAGQVTPKRYPGFGRRVRRFGVIDVLMPEIRGAILRRHELVMTLIHGTLTLERGHGQVPEIREDQMFERRYPASDSFLILSKYSACGFVEIDTAFACLFVGQPDLTRR